MPLPQTEKIKDEVIQRVDLVEEYTQRIIHWAKDFLPQLAFALITLVVGLWVIKRISRLAEKAMERRDLDVSLRTFLKSLIGIGLKIILIITVAGMIGFQSASFVTILGAAGLAIGLALQGSLSNFAGGVLILIFKPYKVGDTIEVLGQRGEVTEIQIFNTILLAADHRIVILPNGAVSNAFIINYSRHGDLRVDIDINVSDKHDIHFVREIILKIISEDPRILKDPEPTVACMEFIENGYTLGVRMYCPLSEKADVHTDNSEKIKTAFTKNGITSPRTYTYVQNVS